MNRAKLDTLQSEIDTHLEPAGFECIEVEWLTQEKILRVFIDHRTNADATELQIVTLDDCTKVTRLLNDWSVLDERITGPYQLEVSSPGLERPLRKEQHFRKFAGQQIFAQLNANIGGTAQGKGRLTGIDNDQMIVVETPKGPWKFPLSAIRKAHIVFDWDREQ